MKLSFIKKCSPFSDIECIVRVLGKVEDAESRIVHFRGAMIFRWLYRWNPSQ